MKTISTLFSYAVLLGLLLILPLTALAERPIDTSWRDLSCDRPSPPIVCVGD